MRSSSCAASRAACFPPRTAPGRRHGCAARAAHGLPGAPARPRRARRDGLCQTREAAAFLSAHLTAGKEYLALAEGAPCKEPEELYDLLFHDRARNKTYVVRRTRAGVREARLICTPLRLLPDGRAALHLQLLTGRTHQIRVQLGSRGCPVCGDRKYGAQAAPGGIQLYAWRLRVPHPDGRSLTFRLPDELLPDELRELPVFPAEPL